MPDLKGPMLGWLDDIYFKCKNHFLSRDRWLFADGWGSDACIEAINHRALNPGSPCPIEVQWADDPHQQGCCRVRSGRFDAPCFQDHLPPESRCVNFRMMVPDNDLASPLVIHTATTREDDYQSRETTALALAEKGIGTILMEGPFRGTRRPAYQRGANLSKVSDFFLLCGSAIEESRSLLQWLHDAGHHKLGIAGISKGGYIAAAAGIRSSMPLAITALVAPHSGVPVFLDGITGRICDWRKMQSTCGGEDVREKLRSAFKATALNNMAGPDRSTKMIFIGASHDRFVPRNSYETMSRYWDGVAVRWLAGGHVSSILDRKYFVQTICDAMAGIGSD